MERAQNEVERLLSEHEGSSLPEDLHRRLEEVMVEGAGRAGLEQLPEVDL